MKTLLISITLLLVASCGHQDAAVASRPDPVCPAPEELIYVGGVGACHVGTNAGRLPFQCDAPLRLTCDTVWCWCK